ncbi:L-fucose dehydrogenase [Flavobacterium akiainvivens]|uniref:L-fucose dehydrogenase n=1 Tax=Flavobacterium akiainvivens TaxID=1202724 RepID=A0A0M8MEN6_9FLAO|nr:aldo/keto reductase [Flavobacterium akiainvivens]KOS04691.1 L-fucose dehydrogenase [Flavobacterium akiainvivens]SFQ64965.1 D-threo-aldose 1-dehydrogenase [Flavobacterium akiainvivens]
MSTTRRNFIHTLTKGAAAAAITPVLGSSLDGLAPESSVTPIITESAGSFEPTKLRYRVPHKIGMGGVALGNGFAETDDTTALQAMQGAWDAGIRYFDTSPWYGLGLSERRMGNFLHGKDKKEYVISTKVGRLMYPDADFTHPLWKGRLNFNYKYDYTADGVRRSVEDSLLRLGIPALDIVFIHDLSPDNGDMKDKWVEYFKVAQNGAMKALTKMREEGLIKAWGLGVNTIEPAMQTLEVADPDVFLSATQYSLVKHKDDLEVLFPACEKRDVSIIVGAPLAAGLLAGKDRYLYAGEKPKDVMDKYAKMKKIATAHKVDLRSAALQFTAAPKVVASTIPGIRTAQQAAENYASMSAKIPVDFWAELKKEKLIEERAEVPKV